MNKEELTPKAKEMFENHKEENVFHATSDGQFFTEKHIESAKTHAFGNKLGELIRFNRDEFEIAEEKGESKEDNSGQAEKGKGKKKK